MANNMDKGKGTPKDDDSGLGNLPPLSDFDSSGGAPGGGSGLPPLSAFDSDKDNVSAGGLPPLDKISIETPQPTGGNIKPAPPGFETAEFESPGFETPVPPRRKERTGFQDLAADSDFSPETPEIGPGPEDVETPMFDSAFGGAGGGSFTPMFETPAPTQAMETPMFGGKGKGPGAEVPSFAPDAFQPGGGDFGGGTPMPDFSPDTVVTGQQRQPTPPITPPPVAPAKAAKKGGGGGGFGVKAIAVAAVCLIVGIVAGPFVSDKAAFLPNPKNKVISEQAAKIADLDAQLKRVVTPGPGTEGRQINPEEIKKLIDEKEQLDKDIAELNTQKQAKDGELQQVSTTLEQVRSEVEALNEEYVKSQEAFEDLQNQTAIVQARQLGLVAEVERLTGMVGKLEDANDRSQMTKQGLTASVEQLLLQVKESIPLTPEKYSRDLRVAAVETLKAKVAEAKWVTPELLDEYTNVYRKELEIAATSMYFFAKLPVVNKLGEKEIQWAECLMKGNWAVYYRTLDGKNVGIYENVAEEGASPTFGFRQDLPDPVKKSVEEEVIASRVEDFAEKLQVIAGKQEIIDGETTSFQRVYNSL